MKLEEIASEAAKLPDEERAALASRMLHSLDVPDYDVSDDEVTLRVREGDRDPSIMITFDQLVAGLTRRGH